ncbi:MAG: hypothetical protein A2612_03145 [Candidatus Moranbacteria bacterium RIFOXYD1_FULL_44_12]|nr:MAG: hypothetical protein A2612_03145 [Candidatus Moranbacteria bacterium RIFOXYD1_FULL_44_12]
MKTIGFYIIIWQMSTFEEIYNKKLPLKPAPPRRIKSFWLKYGEKIILAFGIILIALVSFEAGYLKGQKNNEEPIEIKQPACAPCPKTAEKANANSASSNSQQNYQDKTGNQPNAENQKCSFVASKNSNKYHLATCQWAERIKPENKICFSSEEEAESRGYQGAKCCIK